MHGGCRGGVDVAGWKGRRVWLKVGGVKSCGWFCVNETQVALNENYCGTYKYEITDLVTPGANATVVVQVNNVRPSRKGIFSAINRWGGIYRDIELEATPQMFIDDAWARGLFDEKSAEVHVRVGGSRCCATETGGSRCCATENADARQRVPPVGGSLPIGEIPLGPARKVATADITFPDISKPVKATLTATLGVTAESKGSRRWFAVMESE